MDTFGFLILNICFYLGSATLSIKELNVPDSIKSGSTDEVILDCDYEASGETGIVLKWFYNGQIEQIYQWIPETNKQGYASGKLKNNIDLKYKASDNKDDMYRALRIKDISPDMSGNYTCKVSSDEHEVSETKQLIIYTPAESGLELVLLEEDSVVICSVNGIFPKPIINLYLSGVNDTIEIEPEESEEIDENGLYNITTILKFDESNVTSPATFVCDLSIPGTNYTLTNNVEYFLEIETETEIIDLEEDNNFNITVNSTEDLSNNTTENSGIANLPTSTLLSCIMYVLFLLIAK